MKKSKHTEESIAFALRQAQTATRVEEVCRKLGSNPLIDSGLAVRRNGATSHVMFVAGFGV